MHTTALDAQSHAPPAIHPPQTAHATQLPLRHQLSKQNVAALANDHGVFDNVNLRPPPSALTAASTAYDPHANHESPQTIQHQRSLTGTFLNNCQPLISRATSTIQQHTSRASFHSPTKSLASFIPSRSALESKASQPNIRAGAKALQSWFNGASGQVRLGVGAARHDESESGSESGSDYDSEDDYQDDGMISGIFNRGPSLTRAADDSQASNQGSTSASTPTSSPKRPAPSTAASRFAWLLNTQKNAAVPPATPSPTYHSPSDELLNLNIAQALFPHGPVDPLAPASFNDLLTSAESLLSRYQTSYRQLSTSLVDARAEQSAQDDELDEADTRIRHLKMQMDTMAARANEQDEQMRRLMEELMFERRARQEEEAARKRSLTLIRNSNNLADADSDSLSGPRRRNRISGSDVSIDSGFESECETDGASVFSRNNCLSPTGTDLSSVAESDDRQATPKSKTLGGQQRSSTYDKVRDGTVKLDDGRGWGCANCEGGSQSAVWGRLAKEREENSALRRRVGQLEDAVDGALNVVDGPWGM